jgi:hypothetical protein
VGSGSNTYTGLALAAPIKEIAALRIAGISINESVFFACSESKQKET